MRQIDGLKRLRSKVQDGTAAFEDFSEVWPIDTVEAALLVHKEDSWDAVKALHRMVMPVTSQYSNISDPTCVKVVVVGWPDGLSGGTEISGEGWGEDEMGLAHAWLLALIDYEINAEILKAENASEKEGAL